MRDYEDDDVVEKGGSTISAFLWGALLGAGAMLLFAPRSGRETRQELSDSFRRLKDTADAAGAGREEQHGARAEERAPEERAEGAAALLHHVVVVVVIPHDASVGVRLTP